MDLAVGRQIRDAQTNLVKPGTAEDVSLRGDDRRADRARVPDPNDPARVIGEIKITGLILAEGGDVVRADDQLLREPIGADAPHSPEAAGVEVGKEIATSHPVRF